MRENFQPESGVSWVLQGGVPIISGGYLLGALGVSGAPGGERDEDCAHRALDEIQERLEFAE
jgi:uncharacterized protein GlcG (DUF336 family)